MASAVVGVGGSSRGQGVREGQSAGLVTAPGDVPGVERCHEPLDGAALSRGVYALEQHAYGRPDIAVSQLAPEREPQGE